MKILSNSPEQTLKCLQCGKPLMHYKVYAEAKISRKIRATCPFCGGNSPTLSIDGLFVVGPIGKQESVNATSISGDDFVDGNEVTTFSINKAK